MNLLSLVFSLLLIFSYGFYACWDKHTASTRLRSTYTSHQQAYRSILNQFESKWYKDLGRNQNPEKKKSPAAQREKEGEAEEEEEVESGFNRECSRINIWPLIHEGREKHPLLYELAAKLIRTFYSSLQTEKRFEYRFLNLLLASAKAALQEEAPFALEKIVLLDPELQKLYYKMLKGTKHWDLKQQVGYPPLLDSFKAIPSQERICLYHANTDIFTALFNAKIAAKLYSEIHRKDGPPPTRELIERLAFEAHLISLDPDLFDLFEYGRPHHIENKKAFIATEGDLFLRKDLQMKGS